LLIELLMLLLELYVSSSGSAWPV